ncbi:MAG: hypothetical protein K6G48_00750 [Acholeplasmatales bacterium]|nr:hypothetical protein [Acholeplasmatales bacterium]
MLNYIEEANKKSIIYYNDTFTECDTYELLLTKVMKDHLFKYDYYKKRIRELFSYKTNVPIYLSKSLMLIKLKSMGSIYYINYLEVKYISYNEKNLLFIFKNGMSLFIDKKGNNISRICEMASNILNYIHKLEFNYYN